MLFLRTALFFLAALMMIACGGDDSSSSGGSKPPPKRRPSNLRPKKKGAGKNQKNANIGKFNSAKLQIPPFNRKAQNIPPEMFTENDKERRDPFRNFQLNSTGDKGMKSSQDLATDDESGIVLLEDYGLNNIKLSGIIWSAGREKALFSSPNGQPTVVIKGDRISKSRSLVKEITHDKVLIELKSEKDVAGKVVTFSLVRGDMPYQIQYEKLRSDQRGIRIRSRRYRKSRRRR